MTTPMDRAVRTARSIPQTDQIQAFDQRAAEIAAWTDLLATLGPADWHRPTVCTLWDVHDIVGHLCGHAEEILRPWLFPLRDRRAAKRHPQMSKFDGHFQVQVEEHRTLSPEQLRKRYTRLWPRANRALRSTPGVIRRLQMDTGEMPGIPKIPLTWLHDVVYLRDSWMHRDDVCQAIGRPFAIGAHDRAVVEQALRELDLAWSGPAFVLELTGGAGGTWQIGTGEPVVTIRADAVEYMRTLSGRAADPVLQVVAGDESVRAAVAAARVPF